MRACVILLAAITALPAQAEFVRIVTVESFRETVTDRVFGDGTGVNVATINGDGTIAGSYEGSAIDGTWVWRDGFFCRDIVYAGRDRGSECQMIEVDGTTLRVTGDLGRGRSGDLTFEDGAAQ
jgi:hypothetical protein